jgi:hypothetical protein
MLAKMWLTNSDMNGEDYFDYMSDNINSAHGREIKVTFMSQFTFYTEAGVTRNSMLFWPVTYLFL